MKFKKNSEVEWKWLGRRIQGKVLEIFPFPVVRNLKGAEITRRGTPENPAYLVLSNQGNQALKLESELEAPVKNKPMMTPRMFSDVPAEEVLPRAQKVSDLKNLGPVSNRVFAKAGIRNASQFIQLGWKKTMVKLAENNPKNCHSLFCYALIGALSNRVWNQIPDDEKAAAQKFCAELRMQLKEKQKKSEKMEKPRLKKQKAKKKGAPKRP